LGWLFQAGSLGYDKTYFLTITLVNIMNRKKQVKFLIHCLGFKKENNHLVHFEKLKKKDWTAVINKAHKHSITPLLYQHLKQFNTQIPTQALERLNKIYLNAFLRNTYIYNELSKILSNANKDNIPIVVLKGAALAESVYSNIALRPMKDLDLYIKIEDVQKINDLLIQLGWKSRQELEDIDHILETGYSLRYEIPLLPIDLHLRVPELSELNIWANVTSIKIGSTDTLVLKPEILLVFLCYHLYEHACDELAELIKFYDIILILRKYREDIKWDYFIQMAFANKCENIIHQVLEIINSDFGEDIPPNVLDKLMSTKYTVQIRKSLYKPLPEILYRIHPIKKIVLAIYLHWMDPKKYTIGNIFKSIFESPFPSKKFIIDRYSPKKSWYFFVYYPVYFATGVKNFFRILFKQIFSR
jgi:hypothetical protein